MSASANEPTVASFVEEQITTACSLSEQGVMLAGESLRNILAEARAQVNDLAKLGAALDGQTQDGVNARVSAASNEMLGFVDQMSQQLSQQAACLDAVQATMRHILRVGAKVDTIAHAARFLSLNAVIEANRLGVAGAASRVIANELRGLSTSIAEANMSIGETASDLSASVTTVSSSIAASLEDSARFRAAIQERLGSVDEAFEQVARTSHATRLSGDARLSEILRMCHEALGGLQFQDPMQQTLRKIVEVVCASGPAQEHVTTALSGVTPATAEQRGEVFLF